MMDRRAFLAASGGGLVALIGGGAVVYSQVPVIPQRPDPDIETAAGWIAYREGGFVLTLPRAEMGQNIATAMKQIACTELGADWDSLTVDLHDTARPGLKPTVGSESIQLFTEPLAQACASLRDAIAQGRQSGEIEVTVRPRHALRVFQAGGFVGKSPLLEQGLDIVTGGQLYAADIHRPGLLYGRVLRAPVSTEIASRPSRWDIDAAQKISGFVHIVEEPGPPIGRAQGLGIIARRPGALDKIEDALAVTWDVEGAQDPPDMETLIDIDERSARGPLPHVAMDGTPREGRWDIDIRFDIPSAPHAPIEPRVAVAEWNGTQLAVWAGSQDAFYMRDFLGDAFGLSVEQVLVQSCRVGGAFGGKTICTVEAEAAALALASGAPVKVQWTRPQELALGFHRPPSSHRVRVRLEGKRVTDWHHAQVSSHIMFTSAVVPRWMQRGTDMFAGDGGVERGMKIPYLLGRARAEYDLSRLPVHTGPWRGLGAGTNALVSESAIDEAAHHASVDPVEFRLMHIEDPRLVNVLQSVADSCDWANVPKKSVQGDKRIGLGVACGLYKGVSYAATAAKVEVDLEGAIQVVKLWCTHDCGMVINPDQVRAQCEGNLVWSLGMVLSDKLLVENGRVVAEDFVEAPIPKITDMPDIEVHLLLTETPPVGAGETAMVSGPGAIVNAVRAATGIRPVSFPLKQTTFAIERTSAS